MLSNLTIVSIFTEIFASGILLAGSVTFLVNYLKERSKRCLLFGLVLLSLFLYTSSTIISQMMFNMGSTIARLIFIHKFISVDLIVCAVLVWLFIRIKFNFKRFPWISILIILLGGLFSCRIMASSVSLAYQEGIIEPIVYYSLNAPVKIFFALTWLFLIGASLFKSAKAQPGERMLLFFSAGGALLIVLAFISKVFYGTTGNSLYLLLAWAVTFFGVVGLFLGEIISRESPIALRPLSFFRTRLLFKLMLVFIFLIVILFEVTTLATLNISKQALSRAILDTYQKSADELSYQVAKQKPLGEEGLSNIQRMVLDFGGRGRGIAFVIDRKGRLIAHPDPVRAFSKEDLSQTPFVENALAGGPKSGEFLDEIEGKVVGAYAKVPGTGWKVIIEEPVTSAYADLRQLETNSLLFIILGIILTAIVGVFFAHSIEKPLQDVMVGTEALSEGDLNYRIDVKTIDEIGKLAEAFNRMAEDLRSSQEKLILSEKLASLGTMAAGFAHEIKNPLVSLRTFTQLLIQQWEDPEFRQKFAALVPKEIERINQIAESLLKFGRPSRPELGNVDINSTLDDVIQLFEGECKKNNVKLSKKLAVLPQIKGDPGQLLQAFMNIILNAIQAMPNGGNLIVKTDVGEMVKIVKPSRKAQKVGDEMVWGEEQTEGKPVPVVFIEVSDTGPGISEGNLKNLFDPFFTTKMAGTGMGLPITLRIIEEHKGTIKVRSKLEKGTTFLITLPQQNLGYG